MELTEKDIKEIFNKVNNWDLANEIKHTKNDNSPELEEEFPTIENDEILFDNKNRIITLKELQRTFNNSIDDALIETNYITFESVPDGYKRFFMNQVYKLTASDLWNKYNIQKNNNEMEDAYISSYGGKLYRSAMDKLEKIRNNSTLIGLS